MVNDYQRSNFDNHINQLHIEAEEYFKNLDKLDDDDIKDMELIIEKLDELDLKKMEVFEDKNRAATWRAGDILIYKTGSNNSNGEPSLTGPTAVLSDRESYVIEASKTVSNGAKVFHWKVSNLWAGASGIKQVGKPYAIKTTLFTDEAWYCSKLTFRQWLQAGYDLRGAMSVVHPIYGILLVTPNDIALYVNTRIYEDWGKRLPRPL